MALGVDYAPREFKGHAYNGIGLAGIKDADRVIASAIGLEVDLVMQFFRLNLADDQPTTYIHADTGVGASHAALIYLSDPQDCRGGTAFWRHRSLGWDRLPAGFVPNETSAKNLNTDGDDEGKWQMDSLVGMKFNRMAIYPTAMFHSRYPREAFGDTPESGRLIWVGFFNLR